MKDVTEEPIVILRNIFDEYASAVAFTEEIESLISSKKVSINNSLYFWRSFWFKALLVSRFQNGLISFSATLVENTLCLNRHYSPGRYAEREITCKQAFKKQRPVRIAYKDSRNNYTERNVLIKKKENKGWLCESSQGLRYFHNDRIVSITEDHSLFPSNNKNELPGYETFIL